MQVCEKVIKPRTQRERIRYVDLPEVRPDDLWNRESGADIYFVSHAWGVPFSTLVRRRRYFCDPFARLASYGRPLSRVRGPPLILPFPSFIEPR